MDMTKRFAFAFAALSVSFGAQALSIGVGQLPGSFLALTASGSGGNVSGGALYPGTVNALPNAAIPDLDGTVGLPSTTTTLTNWIAAGPGNTNNGGGSSTLALPGSTTAVSFLWGSPDTYNSFSFVVNGSTTSNFSAEQLVAALPALDQFPLDQEQGKAYYIKLTAGANETITSLTFSSPVTNAIEISNVTVVPEPEAYGLALAGMGVVAFAMRRRRTA
jgi:hypothetical protein